MRKALNSFKQWFWWQHGTKHFLRQLIVAFCLVPPLVFSQVDTTSDKTEVVDLYLSGGNSPYPVFLMSQAGFKKIVPQSKILSGDIMQVDFNDFNSDTSGGFSLGSRNNSLYVQAGITLRLKNKEFKKAGPWLKLGLSYFSSSTFLKTGVFRSTSTNQDSLYSLGLVPVNRTTVSKHSVTYEYSCQSLNSEATLIYKLNPEGVFSLYGGPGAMLGLNFGGNATIVSTKETFTSDYLFGPGKTLYKSEHQTNDKVKESFSFRPNLCFGLFINIGVDLRLGNSYEFIRNTHVFAEVKPMFRGYGVKNAGVQGSVILVFNAGLRYEFN